MLGGCEHKPEERGAREFAGGQNPSGFICAGGLDGSSDQAQGAAGFGLHPFGVWFAVLIGGGEAVGECLIQQEKQGVVSHLDLGDVADVDTLAFVRATALAFVHVGFEASFLIALVCGAHEVYSLSGSASALVAEARSSAFTSARVMPSRAAISSLETFNAFISATGSARCW